MPKKMAISFSGSSEEISLKKKRASILLSILRAKTKKEEKAYQKQLSVINKQMRAL